MFYLILATFSFATTLIFIKLTTAKVNPVLSSLLFPAFAAIVQISVLFFLRSKGVKFVLDRHTLLLIAIGGLVLGVYTITLYLSVAKLGVSKTTPIVYIGAVALTSAFGVLFFKEPFTWVNGVGILLAFGGLALLFVK